ncbi:TetR/AcrR family transcriptional regulator [Microbacterium tumbae]
MRTATAWDRQRAALRQEIADAALELFVRHGFETTTVDAIVDAVGISRRSFFRYFGTKEDVLLGDLNTRGDAVARALAARPATEGAWEALRGAMVDAQPETFHDARSDLAVARMMRDTPSLRARRSEKRQYWQEVLTPLVARRIPAEDAELRAAAIVSAMLACVDVASDAWVDSEGEADMERLYDSAVAAIRS